MSVHVVAPLLSVSLLQRLYLRAQGPVLSLEQDDVTPLLDQIRRQSAQRTAELLAVDLLHR